MKENYIKILAADLRNFKTKLETDEVKGEMQVRQDFISSFFGCLDLYETMADHALAKLGGKHNCLVYWSGIDVHFGFI